MTENSDPANPSLTELILEHFPTPLANAYQRLLQAKTGQDRFFPAIELFDIGIRSLALMYVRQYLLQDLAKGMNSQGLNQALSSFSQPSLGTWLEILLAAIDAYEDQRESHPLPELYDILENEEHDKIFRKACWEIVSMRNDVVHRFAPDTEEKWEAISRKLVQQLETVLNFFRFIQMYSLVDITEVQPGGALGVEYKGLRPRAVVLPADSATLEVDRLYLWNQIAGRNRYYSIHPLIISWPPDRESQDAALYESLTKERIRYLATLLRDRVGVSEKSAIDQLALALDEIRLRRRQGRRTARKLTWELWKQITMDITQMETEAIRAKYDPNVYLQRMAAKSTVDQFLTSGSTGLILLGKSGVGKSNFLLSLLENHANMPDTAILMLDAARLPVQNSLDVTLSIMIREVASLPDDLMAALEKDLWSELFKLMEGKKFILIFDAINENDKARELLKQIDRLIGGGKRAWLKVIISSRPQAWQIIQRGLHLAEQHYFRLAEHAELGIELEGFSLTEQGAELKDFTADELPEVYAKYHKVWNLQTEYADLPHELKHRLRDPLTLKLIAEIYEKQLIPPYIDVSELYARYVERLIKDNRLESQDVILLEQDLMPLMISTSHYSNEISADQVAETNLHGGRPLRDLIFDATQLDLHSKVNSTFTRLTDTEILVKQGGDLDFTIRFKYERFYDYYAGKTIIKQIRSSSKSSYTEYSNFLKELREHQFLWGAIYNSLSLFIRENNVELIENLAQSSDKLARELLASILIDLGKLERNRKQINEIADTVFKIKNSQEQNIIYSKCTAIQVAGNLNFADLITEGLFDQSETVQTYAMRSAYHLWRLDQEKGMQLLETIAERVRPKGIIPDFKAISSCLGITGLILTEKRKLDISNPETVELLRQLQQIWQKIIAAIFFINKQNSALESVARRIRPAIIKPLIDILLNYNESGGGKPSMKKELEWYFKLPQTSKSRTQRLILALTREDQNLDDLKDDLYAAAEENDTFESGVVFMLLLLHGQKDIERALSLSSALVDISSGGPGIFATQVLFALDMLLLAEEYMLESWAKEYDQIFRNCYKKSGGFQTFKSTGVQRFGLSFDRYCVVLSRSTIKIPNLVEEMLRAEINNINIPRLIGLLEDLEGIAIIFHSPNIALNVSREWGEYVIDKIRAGHEKSLPSEVITQYIHFLARCRLYYPDDLDQFLLDLDAPEFLAYQIRTTYIPENLWGELLGYHLGVMAADVVKVAELRPLIQDTFLKGTQEKSVSKWLLYVGQRLFEFVYGSDIF